MFRSDIKPEESMWVSGNHIFTGDHDEIVATVYDKFLDKKNILGAAQRMFTALEHLESINFGSSGSVKELASAIMDARQALAMARGRTS